MKRELERISGAGSVDVDSPRAKRRKETAQAAMPATTSKSNNVASDPSAIKFKQDAISLWSTVKDASNKECGFLLSHLSNRSYTPFMVVGVGCSLQSSSVCRQNASTRITTSKSKIQSPSTRSSLG